MHLVGAIIHFLGAEVVKYLGKLLAVMVLNSEELEREVQIKKERRATVIHKDGEGEWPSLVLAIT